MKQRFSAIDLKAEITCLKSSILNSRLVNIYDINGKTKFLLKFSVPDEKAFLLVESGIRLHLTGYDRNRSGSLPTGFTAKLRKHLRTKRLVKIEQHGLDRSVDFQFAEGSYAFHLIVELYSSGNVILTDSEYNILSLLRTVKDAKEDAERTSYFVGNKYRIDLAEQFKAVSREQVAEIMAKTQAKDFSKNQTLRKYLSIAFASSHGTTLIDHILALQHLDGNVPASQFTDIPLLADGFELSYKLINSLDGPESPKGFIVSGADLSFDSVYPFKPANYDSELVLEFDSFDKALDEFFTKLEASRLSAKRFQVQDQVRKKIDNIANSQQQQMQSLLALQENAMECAQAIVANISLVEQLLNVVRQLVASGMDWKDMEHLLERERKSSNNLASCIVGLKLEKGQILARLPTLNDGDESLSESSGSDFFDSESESEQKAEKGTDSCIDVYLDIYSTAYANAQQYYSQKKKAQVKTEKTLKKSAKAQKEVQKKAPTVNDSLGLSANFVRIRKPFWFERFLWFISSEGYLVIGGRDAQQNELLVRRYMRNNDVYVHADMHGACSVIIRQPDSKLSSNEDSESLAIPPNTLSQAGTLSVCCSRAWEAKIVASAYWVYASQVNKTAPTGEYLTTGSFMVRGKKNFLPPVQLQYGAGMLFIYDEEDTDTRANHPPLQEWMPSQRADYVGVTSSSTLLSQELERYGIDTPLAQTEIDKELEQLDLGRAESALQAGSAPTAKRYLSSKERRQLRKKATSESAGDDTPTDQSTSEHKPNSLQPDSDNISVETKKQTTGKLPRGKRSKLKKMKLKYKDQDEEDREFMLEMIGSVKKSNEAASEDVIAAPSPAKQSTKAQAPTVTSTRNPADSFEAVDSKVLDDSNFLTKITAIPKPNDALVSCLVTVAPWQALSRFSVKVKLLPGSLKKGKATKAVLNYFSAWFVSQEKELLQSLYRYQKGLVDAESDKNPAQLAKDIETVNAGVELVRVERELLKSVKEDDLVTLMLPKVRLAIKSDFKK